jgi:hypothetical protein
MSVLLVVVQVKAHMPQVVYQLTGQPNPVRLSFHIPRDNISRAF